MTTVNKVYIVRYDYGDEHFRVYKTKNEAKKYVNWLIDRNHPKVITAEELLEYTDGKVSIDIIETEMES